MDIHENSENFDKKGAKKEAESDQNGAKGVPKASKMEPEGCQNETRDLPKHPLWNRIEKGRKKGHHLNQVWSHFRSHFPSKIGEKIDTEIGAEKVMKIEEKTMRKHTCILMIFGFASHEKSRFSEKVHVREP